MIAAKEKTFSPSSESTFAWSPRGTYVQAAATSKHHQPSTTRSAEQVVSRFTLEKFRACKSKKSPIGSKVKSRPKSPWPNRRSPEKTLGENVVQLRRSHWAIEMSQYRGYFVPNGVDPLGLDWKIVREGEAWARAVPESGQESIEDLAKLIKLDPAEYEKWLQISSEPHWAENVDVSASVESQWCGLPEFHVPNTWAVFQAQRTMLDASFAAMHCRGMAENSYYSAQQKGFKVDFAYKTKKEFKNLWKKDGIYAFTAGGHGSKEGFTIPEISSKSFVVNVSPFEVRPPYKLARVAIFSCYSANDIPDTNRFPPRPPRPWRFHVSDLGEFVGHKGPYFLWDSWKKY